MSVIGQSIVRPDAFSKVVGDALYPGDFFLEDQVYLKVLFAERPHARVKRVDTSSAADLAGVLAVLTARDVPINEYGLMFPDQPVLCGPGSDKAGADRVRFIGDQVALVIAESEAIARQALQLIRVDYEDLPVLSDPQKAMRAGAPQLHPDYPNNIICESKIRKGDLEAGFAAADVIVEADYVTPFQEHLFLQPEAGVAYLDDEGRITVVVAGQNLHLDRSQIAHALALPEDQLRVIYPAIGGAFGGREDMSVQIILALAVQHLQQRGIYRPVKTVWTREESIIGHCKKHPFYVHARWGANRQGLITAAEMDITCDGGAYAYTSGYVLNNSLFHFAGPYEIPNIHMDARAVYTNNIPSGAFRGFGASQAAFISEMQVAKLAQELGLDPVEFRLRNALTDSSLLPTNDLVVPGVSIIQVIEDTALAGGWKKTKQGWKRPKPEGTGNTTIKAGIGFASIFKNVGFTYGYIDKCSMTVELHGTERIEKVVVRSSLSELGQGSGGVLVQFAAHALKVPLEMIELQLIDTANTESAGATSASRATFMAGHAIFGAAEAALQAWQDQDRPAEATYTYAAPETTNLDPETGACNPSFAYAYSAAVAKVAVDTETGQVTITDLICSSDVGKAVNPQQVEGQIEGGSIMGVGNALLENFVVHDGVVQTRTMSTYLIPTVLDIPESMQPLVLEYPDPRGPSGARGVGELPSTPVPPAITAAVHAALGVWCDALPMTPERILTALKQA